MRGKPFLARAIEHTAKSAQWAIKARNSGNRGKDNLDTDMPGPSDSSTAYSQQRRRLQHPPRHRRQRRPNLAHNSRPR